VPAPSGSPVPGVGAPSAELAPDEEMDDMAAILPSTDPEIMEWMIEQLRETSNEVVRRC